MKFRIYALALLLAMSVPASAGIVSLGFLVAGNGIISHDWVFSDWEIITNTADGLATVANINRIDVTDTEFGGVVTLRFDIDDFDNASPQMLITNDQPNITSNQNLQFRYRAEYRGDPAITLGPTAIRTQYESNVDENPLTGGLLEGDSLVVDANGLNPLQLATDLNTRTPGNLTEPNDFGNFTGTDEPLFVTTEFRMDVDAGTGFFHEITTFSQDFQPVPVPAAVWLLGSALGLFGIVARRRRLA